jgi:hypothetical protein
MEHCANNNDFKNGVPTHVFFTSDETGVQKLPVGMMLFPGGFVMGESKLLKDCNVQQNSDGYSFATPTKNTTDQDGKTIVTWCQTPKILFGPENASKKRRRK